MELNVKWGNHSFKADPKKVYLEITSIADEVKPQQMVDYAKAHKDSELYKCFTWDNQKAADCWRLEEARLIHRNLVIEYTKSDNDESKEKVRVRATYRTDTSPSAGYKPLTLIMKDEDERAGLLRVAKAELQSFRYKYRILSELKPIFDLIDEL